MNDVKVALVFTSCNTAPLLEICLKSHRLFTPTEGVSYVLADASDDDSCKDVWENDTDNMGVESLYVDFRQQQPTYSVKCDSAVRRLLSQGVRPKYWVFANDDTLATPDWMQTMEAEFQFLAGLGYKVGLLGARSNFVTGTQRCVWTPGEPGILACPRIVSFFCLISADTYDDAGGFDIALPAHHYSDDALSVRLIRSGYYNFCSRAFIPHFGHQAFRRSNRDSRPDVLKGRMYMKEQYGEDWQVIYDYIYPDLISHATAPLNAKGTEYQVRLESIPYK